MCVIIHTKRKELLKKRELAEAMRTNSAGFFLAVLKEGGQRDVLRTMDEKEATKFWDDAPDDAEMVMHFRIPSRGDRGIQNVHGWEEDGILFSHNMTLSCLDDAMRKDDWKNTDSEYFFRMVFMPLYRAFGAAAYKDGMLCEPLDRVTRIICGSGNRFCFVMPDNVVLKYGSWTGDDPSRKTPDGQPGFFASNTSYKVYGRLWPEYGKGGGATTAPGFCGYGGRGGYDPSDPDDFGDAEGYAGDHDYWYPDGNGGYLCGERQSARPLAGTKPARAVVPAKKDEFDGSVVRKLVGDAGVAKLALADLVMHNLVGYWEAEDEDDASAAFVESMHDWFFPTVFNGDAIDVCQTGIACIAQGPATFGVDDFVKEYAAQLEKELAKDNGSGYKVTPYFRHEAKIETALQGLITGIKAWCRAANVHLDWHAPSAEEFATVYEMHQSRRGRPYLDTVCWDDLLYLEDVKGDDTLDAVERVLRYIRRHEGDKPKEGAK